MGKNISRDLAISFSLKIFNMKRLQNPHIKKPSATNNANRYFLESLFLKSEFLILYNNYFFSLLFNLFIILYTNFQKILVLQ